MGPIDEAFLERLSNVSVVVRRMYYWDRGSRLAQVNSDEVSVVVRRMYYWDYVEIVSLSHLFLQFQ